jgi:Uma2 family endonuclease
VCDVRRELLPRRTERAKPSTRIVLVSYQRTGVREYWIVDPDQKSVETFCLGPTGFTAP